MHVTVVGAGVLGASLARSLAEGGARVTLVEGEAPGSGTSGRGAGLVCEGLWHPASIALAARSLDLLDEDGMLRRTGSTTLVPERLAPAARDLAERQRAEGVDVRTLRPGEVSHLPRHGLVSAQGADLALHYPRDGWSSPPDWARLCADRARRAGARVVMGHATLGRDAEGVHVVAAGARFDADAVVLAAGIHTRRLLTSTGLDAPLLAYRTQAARVRHALAAEVPVLHDAVSGFYLRPGAEGELVAGNGTTTTPEDPDAWTRAADPAFVDATLARLRARLPPLANASIDEAWAGLDAATPDRLFLAGPHPAEPRVWLLTGGNGHGFMRAPALGESVAAMLLSRAPRVPLDAFDPARFGPGPHAGFPIREGYALEAPGF